MCYSVRIKASLKELGLEFRAKVDLDSFEGLFHLRLSHPELKVPLSLDRYFATSRDPLENRLRPLIERYHQEEDDRIKQEVSQTEEVLFSLSSSKPSAQKRKKIESKEKKLVRLREKIGAWNREAGSIDDRVFPYYFAPVILEEVSGLSIKPMRYRVQGEDGTEIPNKYNVFNARLDSLLSARTWIPLFTHQHGIFPFTEFFEWVERDGKKKEIVFHPQNHSLMWAPCLYSYPSNKNALPIYSFALITDDPPQEVARAGHDRCPIFLSREKVNDWLQPKQQNSDQLMDLLRSKEKVFYINSLVA